jgi:carboxymethylenebutenolidase
MGQFINLSAADGFSFPAYVAEPATGKARGAVVVLQEIFGVNSHIRAVADGYAADGYLAVAPATFHRVKQGVELGYTADDMGAGIALKSAVEALPAPGVMADIEAAVAYASRQGRCGRLLLGRLARLAHGLPGQGRERSGTLLWRRRDHAGRGGAQAPVPGDGPLW